MNLTDTQRNAIRQRRKDQQLTQAAAGQIAWPNADKSVARSMWSQIENGRSLSVAKLQQALNAIGLQLQIRLVPETK